MVYFPYHYIFFAIHRMPFCLDDLKVLLGESSPHPPRISPFTVTISQNIQQQGWDRRLGDEEHLLLPGTGVHSQHPSRQLSTPCSSSSRGSKCSLLASMGACTHTHTHTFIHTQRHTHINKRVKINLVKIC